MAAEALSRRGMLASAAAAWAGGGLQAQATAAASQLGVQLWMLRGAMAADFAGSLSRLAGLGVREVELAGVPDLPARGLRAVFQAAGLACISAHQPVLQMTDEEFDRRLDFVAALGAADIVAAMPGFAGLLRLAPSERLAALMAHRFTVDDWGWNAERLNHLGERAGRAGLRLAYHNHNAEFARFGDVSGFEILLHRTDPLLVHFQLDVGNAVIAGEGPAVLQRLSGRLLSVHLKDWRGPLKPTLAPASPAWAPFGEGVIDWAAWWPGLVDAAPGALFIEQENLPPARAFAAVGQGLDFFGRLARSSFSKIP